MKILLFHPVALPPKDYGGVERVVLWLSEALRDLGHGVTVACLEGSRLPPGVSFLPIELGARSAADLVSKIPPGTDLVHFQAPPEAAYFKDGVPPALTTVHGLGKPGEIFHPNTVFVSRDHAKRHGRKTFVYNGLNPDEFSLAENLGLKKHPGTPLFLSKTTLKTKNLAGAMMIARAARLPLTIAGGNRPLALRTKALFSGHRWIGPVAGEVKAKLLAEASSLLFPVCWPEPFGLVMVEAMLSGTPVVGARIGSVPEVLDGTGSLVLDLPRDSNDVEGMALWGDALRNVEKLDPVELRKKAIERFSHHRMAESYLEVYKRIIRGESL